VLEVLNSTSLVDKGPEAEDNQTYKYTVTAITGQHQVTSSIKKCIGRTKPLPTQRQSYRFPFHIIYLHRNLWRSMHKVRNHLGT
ncbi:hypothetical protein TGAM01_v208518, partial [Trichoderma gamsii]